MRIDAQLVMVCQVQDVVGMSRVAASANKR